MEKGFLLDDDMLGFFSQIEDKKIADEIMSKIKSFSSERVITKSLVHKNIGHMQDIFSSLGGEKRKIVERFFINLGLSIEIKKESYIAEEKTKQEQMPKNNFVKITSLLLEPPKKIRVADFVNHFRWRFTEIRGILQERRELQNLTSIDRVNGQRQNVSIIALVSGKRVTKNKNILLDIEDLTGQGIALINQNKTELYNIAKDVILDDIIGLRCTSSGEMFFVNDIIYPDAALLEKKRAEKEVYAVFTSDIHVGSDRFLEENFLKFVDWINGKLNHKEDVKKVKYLFIAGDNVDGVGVYPGQESLLKIKNIRGQYEKLAELLGMIRKDVNIVMCPGQHDAVRAAEPQPAIDNFFAPQLHKMENLTLATNPCYATLQEGFSVLMYHGDSFHGLKEEIESLRAGNPYDKPTQFFKQLLKRRHLAPTHSSVVYIPSEKDPLLITKIPDIAISGEVHKVDVDSYNNIIIISNSCWQAQTPYEEKIGHHPDPCKVPMLNLKTREIKILDFS